LSLLFLQSKFEIQRITIWRSSQLWISRSDHFPKQLSKSEKESENISIKRKSLLVWKIVTEKAECDLVNLVGGSRGCVGWGF